MTELEAMCLLVTATGADYRARAAALDRAGSAQAVLAEPEAFRRALGEAGVAAVRTAAREKERILDSVYEAGVSLLMPGMPGWSKRLSETAQPPHLLFCQGEAWLDDDFAFSIVGTRRADGYGLRQTRAIAEGLASAGVAIVSGLALGVDAAAHAGALDAGGRTIAVLGGGLDCFFPEENTGLMRRMLDAGGTVVTEYPLGTAPQGKFFLRRNRIIAGLSLGVLVTQGAFRSGATRTAHDALEAGREVFALPGNVDNALSGLPNRLLSEGAHVATCARDILSALVIEPPRDWQGKKPEPAETEKTEKRASASRTSSKKKPEKPAEPDAPKATPDGLDGQALCIWNMLAEGEKDFDELAEAVALADDELSALLVEMEMDGQIEALPGLLYRLA